jgi:hypothetical protein
MAANPSQPYGFPSRPTIKGAMLVAMRNTTTKIAPKIEPKALFNDFP